jgi:hypothetical protein
LEEKRNTWLKKEEHEWRLKSRDLQLQAGDNNTKLFHHYCNNRRNVNTIWEVKDEKGSMVRLFQDKAEARARFFENLFLIPRRGCPIQGILYVVTKFYSIFSDEMNHSLEEEVTKLKLCATLSSMQNGKILGLDGFTVEFFQNIL